MSRALRHSLTCSCFALQRGNLFFPPWAFALPGSILRLPYSLVEGTIYVRNFTA